jgi:hypothetical protein
LSGFIYCYRKEDVKVHKEPVLAVSAIKRMVAISACRANFIALLETKQAAVAVRNISESIGLAQSAIPINCDNQAVTAIANNTTSGRERAT